MKMPITKQNSSASAGDVKPWLGTSAPAGWLKCNGAAVSRSLYAALYNVIGTTYGAGDGSTTFNLPDFRGEFLRGLDDGRGIDTGRTIGAFQQDAFQGHFHSVGAFSVAPGAIYNGATRNEGQYKDTGAPITDGINGTPRTATETRPRNQAALYVIKY